MKGAPSEVGRASLSSRSDEWEKADAIARKGRAAEERVVYKNRADEVQSRNRESREKEYASWRRPIEKRRRDEVDDNQQLN